LTFEERKSNLIKDLKKADTELFSRSSHSRERYGGRYPYRYQYRGNQNYYDRRNNDNNYRYGDYDYYTTPGFPMNLFYRTTTTRAPFPFNLFQPTEPPPPFPLSLFITTSPRPFPLNILSKK
jgi:hypothetical protein